jgi:chemotaxis protein CheX
MTITSDEIRYVVQDTWHALLGLEVCAVGGPPAGQRAGLAGVVGVDGGWCGMVRLTCSARLGILFASRMLDLRADDVDRAGVQDAVGELVNVVGGNVKALLPTPSRLVLPRVEPWDGDPRVAPEPRAVSAVFDCLGDAFEVEVAGHASADDPGSS